MPKISRGLVDNFAYHVLNRGNGKEKVFHHSDGYIYPIVGDLIDIGSDILHPVQPEVMDIFRLKEEFGNDLTFFGGFPTQNLLPGGQPKKSGERSESLNEKWAEEADIL